MTMFLSLVTVQAPGTMLIFLFVAMGDDRIALPTIKVIPLIFRPSTQIVFRYTETVEEVAGMKDVIMAMMRLIGHVTFG